MPTSTQTINHQGWHHIPTCTTLDASHQRRQEGHRHLEMPRHLWSLQCQSQLPVAPLVPTHHASHNHSQPLFVTLGQAQLQAIHRLAKIFSAVTSPTTTSQHCIPATPSRVAPRPATPPRVTPQLDPSPRWLQSTTPCPISFPQSQRPRPAPVPPLFTCQPWAVTHSFPNHDHRPSQRGH
jgi:hypothetical protein